MPIQRVSDIVAAVDEGRTHTQRFLKNASVTGDTQWIDWSFASGQPSFDARVGVPIARAPMVAARNDAIWFPGIGAGQERRLAQVMLRTAAGGANQSSVDAIVYDLVAIYPLIDGDSTDPQNMDNTLVLPRYTTGAGLVPVMVNHVAPQLAAGTGTYNYTTVDGGSRTAAFNVTLTGLGKNVGDSGAFGMPGNYDGGVRSIDQVTFTSPPGGLYCIYLLKPLTTITNIDGALTTDKVATEKDLLERDAWRLPLVPDGAWLGFFIRPNGGATTVSIFGNMTFIWG